MRNGLKLLLWAVAGAAVVEGHLTPSRGSAALPAFIRLEAPSFASLISHNSTSSDVRAHSPGATHFVVPRIPQGCDSSAQDRVSQSPSLASVAYSSRTAPSGGFYPHRGLPAFAAVTGTGALGTGAAPGPTTDGDFFGLRGNGAGSLVRGGMRGNLRSRRENVSPVVAQMLYEDMLLGRYVEDACARLYYRGKTAGFVHLYTGQEAVSTGVLKLLRKDDAVASTYRDHVHATSKGVPARQVFAELFGKNTGCSRGFGGSMHMFSKEWNLYGGFAFIGEQIPIALGVAFSQLYRRLARKELPGEKDQVDCCTDIHLRFTEHGRDIFGSAAVSIAGRHVVLVTV